MSYGALLRLVSHSAIVFVHSSFFFSLASSIPSFFFFNLRDTPTITVISLPFFFFVMYLLHYRDEVEVRY